MDALSVVPGQRWIRKADRAPTYVMAVVDGYVVARVVVGEYKTPPFVRAARSFLADFELPKAEA